MRPSGLRSPNPSFPPSDDVEEDAVDRIDETLFRNPPTAHHAPTPLPAHPTPTPPPEEDGRPEARGEEDEEEEQVLAVDPKE